MFTYIFAYSFTCMCCSPPFPPFPSFFCFPLPDGIWGGYD